MLAVAVALRRYFARVPVVAPRSDAVTILKPLYGAEPKLAANLATFLDQQHDGPIQLVCGVQRSDDPAIAVVEALKASRPEADIQLVIDSTRHGASGKISNLTNMMNHTMHDVAILSDSDIAVAPDYLARVLAALDAPGVGAVTCLYAGRGDAGFWSRVAAAGINWQFLPGAVFGVSLGLAKPCMGSTIAMRRTTLDAIGGFVRFADVLADDHAIGAAVEALDLKIAIPPMLVVHGSGEADLAEFWRHELRWNATLRGVVPAATYAVSIIGFPLPIALLAIPLVPVPALVVACLAWCARLIVVGTVDRIAGRHPAPLFLLPLRDCLSFGLFMASWFARSVDWRGVRLRVGADGRVAAGAETSLL